MAIDIGVLANNLIQKSLEVTIIYPNNGTQAAPATIAANQRYVMDNPFPGFYVHCMAQIYKDGNWGETGFVYQTYGYGVAAYQLNDTSIVIQSGNNQVMQTSVLSGNPFGNTAVVPSAPVRVIVVRMGKMA